MTTLKTIMYMRISGSTCAKAVPGVHPGSDTTHDPIARHKQRRPCADETAHPAADNVVEELEPRRTMVEVFSGSQKRHHGDLCRAQKHVRQPRARRAAG